LGVGDDGAMGLQKHPAFASSREHLHRKAGVHQRGVASSMPLSTETEIRPRARTHKWISREIPEALRSSSMRTGVQPDLHAHMSVDVEGHYSFALDDAHGLDHGLWLEQGMRTAFDWQGWSFGFGSRGRAEKDGSAEGAEADLPPPMATPTGAVASPDTAAEAMSEAAPPPLPTPAPGVLHAEKLSQTTSDDSQDTYDPLANAHLDAGEAYPIRIHLPPDPDSSADEYDETKRAWCRAGSGRCHR